MNNEQKLIGLAGPFNEVAVERLSQRDFQGYLALLDLTDKWQGLSLLRDHFGSEQVFDSARLLHGIWISLEDGDAAQEQLRTFLGSQGPQTFSDMDSAVFNALPDQFAIYRGSTIRDKTPSIVWSLSKDVALYFAEVNVDAPRDEPHTPVLWCRQTSKSDVAFFTDAREEQEIVLWEPALATETYHPTDDDFSRAGLRRSASRRNQTT